MNENEKHPVRILTAEQRKIKQMLRYKPDYWACFTSDMKTFDAEVFNQAKSIDKKLWVFHDINNEKQSINNLRGATKEQMQQLIADITKYHELSYQRPVTLLFSCYAGISRSAAAALIALAITHSARHEVDLALFLRDKNRYVTPNRRMCLLADELLKRKGRLLAARDAMQRGSEAFAGGTTLILGAEIENKLTKICHHHASR